MSTRATTGICVAITSAILLVHVLDHWVIRQRYGLLFNVEEEANLPTWWAQVQLALAALIALVVAVLGRTSKMRDWPYWLVVVAALLFMSIDEGAQLHERSFTLIEPFVDDASGFLSWSWVILGAIAVLVVCAVLLRFWLRLPATPRWLLALSAVVFASGALGLEMIGAARNETHGTDDVYMVLATVEEALEFYGVAIAIYAILLYMRMTPELRTGTFEIVE